MISEKMHSKIADIEIYQFDEVSDLFCVVAYFKEGHNIIDNVNMKIDMKDYEKYNIKDVTNKAMNILFPFNGELDEN